jgi:hypothetical protein
MRRIMTNQPDKRPLFNQKRNLAGEHKERLAKEAAALLADLFWDQYLYNKQQKDTHDSQTHVDENRGS